MASHDNRFLTTKLVLIIGVVVGGFDQGVLPLKLLGLIATGNASCLLVIVMLDKLSRDIC